MEGDVSSSSRLIIKAQLLETGVPQMDWPAFSPYLNLIEKLWVRDTDQLSCRVEACDPLPQTLNDLRAALQKKWDAMAQQTIRQHVNRIRHCWQAVIDAQGHISY